MHTSHPGSSPQPSSPAAPSAGDLELIDRLRQDLTAARFTNDDVARLLGPGAVAALDREQIVPGQLRILDLFAQAAGMPRPAPEDQAGSRPDTAGIPEGVQGVPLSPRAGRGITAHMPTELVAPGRIDPCAVLTGLWLLAVDVTAEQVDAALPRTGVAGLERLGLVRTEQSGSARFCRPAVDLRPYQVQQDGGRGRRAGADARVVPADPEEPAGTGAPERTDESAGADGASTPSVAAAPAPAGILDPAEAPDTAEQRDFADLWVTSDLSAHQVEGPLPSDHVLGIGQASLTLASATHRRPVRRALDLGTGCGIQIFHLLAHADHVVGTDLSRRALDFTRFNLLLNAPALGLDPERLEERVELLEGSLLEPVAGRRFEMVVSNPPFVITPRSQEEDTADRYTYRDGGRRGDELMEELITGLPEVLAPGGTAQMLGNWEIPAAESGPADQQDWCSRPRRWADTSGLDAWFIQRERQSPAQYAETWLRDASEERDLVEYRRRYADYLQDFDSRCVSGVGFGMIWLQRPAESAAPECRSAPRAAPWRRFEELTGEVQQPLGPAFGRTAERALAVAAQPQVVLEQALEVPGDVTEERHQRFGAPHPEVILARQGAGLRRVRPVSSAAAGFLGAADGEFSAAQLITAVVALLDDGQKDASALEDSLRREVLDLYVDGFLIQASAAEPAGT